MLPAAAFQLRLVGLLLRPADAEIGDQPPGRRHVQVAAGRRDMEVVLEALALFVRYQLTVTAPLPEADAAALATGNQRFERFIAQLGRQIAGGKRTLDTQNIIEALP